MPGLFQSLDIARRAIYASRLGMDVTSHNIANVNTPGFSRQRVENRAANPIQLPEGQLGLGVSSESISRIRDNLLDRQFRQSAFSLGGATVKENLFTQVESILKEPSENALGSLMTGFFSSFSELAADPENMTVRNMVRQNATSLVDAFHYANDQLNSLQNSISQETQSAVNQVNELSRQIAALNSKISSAEAGSGQANDLRDRRDMLVDQLAEYVNINYSEGSRGQLTINAEGVNLVSGDSSNRLSVKDAAKESGRALKLVAENGKQVFVRYGKLGGLLEMHGQTLPDIRGKLDALAENLADKMNTLHRAGKGLAVGNPPAASSGVDFFTGSSAGTIDISPEIMDDVAKIAASGDGSAGNGDVAMAISNLRNEKVFNGRSQTLNDFYNSLVSDIGVEIQKVQSTRQSQELMSDQIVNQRDQVSGVSLDEEMTNLIKYQRSFEAAAKVVSVVDQVMETVINMV